VKKLMNVRILPAAVAMLGALGLFAGVANASSSLTNVDPPTISGNAWSSQTLTADPGSWSGHAYPGFSYQWEDCDTNGLNCTPIPGATNSIYTVAQSDIGDTIVVEVSAGSTTAVSSATDVVPNVDPPSGGSCSLTPRVGTDNSGYDSSGGSDVGTVFTVTCENWSDPLQTIPLTYTAKWYWCDTNGENCSLMYSAPPTFVPSVQSSALSDFRGGGAEQVRMIITNAYGASTTWQGTLYVSDSSTGVPQSDWTSPPTVSGTASVGQTLSVDPGGWSGNPSFSYQWYDCGDTFPYTPDSYATDWYGCNPIGGATDSTYTLQDSDHGSTILAEVTATNDQGETVVDPATTGFVVNPAPVNTAPATISDSNPGFSPGEHPVTGDTLTASGDSWTGDTSGGVSYQWEDCDTNGSNCEPILGATNATYTVAPEDTGSTIAVDMTATNVDGLSTDALSLSTATVPSSDADLSGLTVSAGTLSPAFAAPTDSYTVSVPNATSSIDLTPTADEAHATVTVNGETVTSGAQATQSLNVGANTITVLVTAQDGATTHTYTLTVTRALPAELSLDSTRHDFGPVTTGQAATQTFTVTNTGSGELSIGQATITGTDPSQFSIGTDTCSNTNIAPGGTCTVDVSFAPNTAGAATAELDLPSDAASGSPATVALTGTGQTPTPSTSTPPTTPTPPTPTPTTPTPPVTTPPTSTPRPPVLAHQSLSARTVVWQTGHPAPQLWLSFTSSSAATLRVSLQYRVHGRWVQQSLYTKHVPAGRDRVQLVGRWHGLLYAASNARLVVCTTAAGRTSKSRTFRVTVIHR
jgi:Cadherin-like beta sandwich domain/Protein of unknown function (DUF1573)